MHAAAALTDDLTERLVRIAHHRPELDVTQLQIINLDDVRKAYGGRWSQVRSRVFSTSMTFLKNRITPEDLLIPAGNGFIIVFGSVDGASAEIAGLQLARALNHFFVGEEGLKDIQIGCKHQTLEVAGIANLVRALNSVDPVEPIEGTLKLDEHMPAAEYLFRYQPLWDVKHEAISVYLTRAFGPDGHAIDGEEHDNPASARRGFLALDLATIKAASGALRQLLARGEQVLIAMSLHASTLADTPQRAEILEALGRIDPQVRRYLMVMLRDVVHGFPRHRLDELVHLLAQKVERVAVELSFDEPDTESIAASGVWAYGFPVPRMLHPLAADTIDSIGSRLQREVKRAHRHGKRLIVDIHGPAETIDLCRSAGVDYVGCAAASPPVECPRGVERCELPKTAA